MNVHAPHAHLVPGEVKRGLDPLGLGLWMVVSYSVDGGNQTQVLGNSSKALASHHTHNFLRQALCHGPWIWLWLHPGVYVASLGGGLLYHETLE